MKRSAASPDEYLAQVPETQRPILEALRSAIRDGFPDIVEGLRYGMLDYPGLANLAAQKNYVALYVAPSVLADRKGDFPGVDSGKSCLRNRLRERAWPLDSEPLMPNPLVIPANRRSIGEPSCTALVRYRPRNWA